METSSENMGKKKKKCSPFSFIVEIQIIRHISQITTTEHPNTKIIFWGEPHWYKDVVMCVFLGGQGWGAEIYIIWCHVCTPSDLFSPFNKKLFLFEFFKINLNGIILDYINTF